MPLVDLAKRHFAVLVVCLEAFEYLHHRPFTPSSGRFTLYRQGVRARRHLLVGWEANPSLVGRQVAVLRLHAALFWLRNDYTLLSERGERNAQLQYLLHFYLRWG